MAKTPRGYEREVREVFRKTNAAFSDSRKHDGLKSSLARDKKTNDLSHTLIGDVVESDSRQSKSFVIGDHQSDVELADWSTPDISRLVPIALVAVAGIAAGVAGAKVAQSRKRRRQEERPSIATSSVAPAGWYEVITDPTRLRHWDGAAWTGDYASLAGAASDIVADWYSDPSDAAQLRYWDGSAWTNHVAPRPGAVATSADWYPDPSNGAQLRYWDGTAWTDHVTSSAPDAAVAFQQATAPTSSAGLAPTHEESRIRMTAAEWRAHLEAWARAGAIQQELWSRLANAHITDVDDATLEAQIQWEALTPQEGAQRLERMLEANPSLRDQSVLVEFLTLFGEGQSGALGVERKNPGHL